MAKKIDHEFWDRYFKVYDVLNLVIPYEELINTIVERLDIKKGDVVLDAGCGTGNLALKMKGKGAKVIGLDYCNEALDRYRLKDPDAEIVIHSLTDTLPFSDNYFDKVAANNVIYTLDKGKRLEIFKEIHRVLKPDGRFVVSDMRKGVKPVQIYYDTLRIQNQRSGIMKTIALILKVARPTIMMLYYNKQFVKDGDSGNIDFLEPLEHVELLKSSGFREISDDICVYSNQAILNSGVK